MKAKIRILAVEDSEADWRLIERQLVSQGFSPEARRVWDMAGLKSALAESEWDAIFLDYYLPGLSFDDLLAEVAGRAQDTPVILVSGRVGEAEATDLLKRGVWDFVLKDELSRIGLAVRRCLKEADMREQQRRAQEEIRQAHQAALNMMEDALLARRQAEDALAELRESRARFALLLDSEADPILFCAAEDNRPGRILAVNASARTMLGCAEGELQSRRFSDVIEAAGEALERIAQDAAAGRPSLIEAEMVSADGRKTPVEIRIQAAAAGKERLFMAVARDITGRRQAEAEAQRKLLAERFVSRVSAAAAMAGPDIDKFVREAIELAGERMGVSRVFLAEFAGKGKPPARIWEWSRPGTRPRRAAVAGGGPWLQDAWHETLRSGEAVCFADTALIPNRAVREELEKDGVAAILIMPLYAFGRYYAFWGAEQCKEKPVVWPPDDLDVFHTAARIIAATIERISTEQALKREHDEMMALFDSIEDAVYVADMDTHEILFANRFLKDLFGKPPVGGKCYIELQNRQSPCPFCTNDRIRAAKYQPYRWEHHNEVLNRDYDIIDRVVRWPDGRDVRFEFARDVTERKKTERRLQEQLEELKRWHDVTVGREERIIELKKEVNELLQRLGEQPRYMLSSSGECCMSPGGSPDRPTQDLE